MTLTPAERDFGIHAAIEDIFRVSRWMLARYPKHATIPQRIVVALAFNDDSLAEWRKLASYTLFELKAIESERALMPMETQLRTTAERLYDVTPPYPEINDRETARRELDAAFVRAVLEVSKAKGQPS